MPVSLTLSSSVLSEVISALLRPHPHDPGPYGPYGPVIRDHEWLELNPQPLPPRTGGLRRGTSFSFGPSPDPWGPQPDPWRFALTVRASISRLVELYEQAGIIVIGGVIGDTDRLAEADGVAVQRLVDELCGTPPRRGPFPGPWASPTSARRRQRPRPGRDTRRAW